MVSTTRKLTSWPWRSKRGECEEVGMIGMGRGWWATLWTRMERGREGVVGQNMLDAMKQVLRTEALVPAQKMR